MRGRLPAPSTASIPHSSRGRSLRIQNSAIVSRPSSPSLGAYSEGINGAMTAWRSILAFVSAVLVLSSPTWALNSGRSWISFSWTIVAPCWSGLRTFTLMAMSPDPIASLLLRSRIFLSGMFNVYFRITTRKFFAGHLPASISQNQTSLGDSGSSPTKRRSSKSLGFRLMAQRATISA